MSLIDLLDAYSVPYATEGHTRVSKGWVGIHCPFCVGNQDFHLGGRLDNWAFKCWRCGSHKATEVIHTVLGVPGDKAWELIRQYREGGSQPQAQQTTNRHVRIKPFKFPAECGPLGKPHLRYLERRGFDAERVAKTWGLLGTGPLSFLDGLNYRFRIVAPIVWNGKTVSFQSRDYTNKADRKYLACVPEREVLSHKTILYGQQNKWGDTGILVEGITDVWRLGTSACATFGIEYQTEQVLQLINHFERIVILFDPEPQAQQQARKMRAQLSGCGVKVIIEKLTDCDPGDLSQDDADHLVRNILRRVL